VRLRILESSTQIAGPAAGLHARGSVKTSVAHCAVASGMDSHARVNCPPEKSMSDSIPAHFDGERILLDEAVPSWSQTQNSSFKFCQRLIPNVKPGWIYPKEGLQRRSRTVKTNTHWI